MLSHQQHYVACSISVPSVPTSFPLLPLSRGGVGIKGDLAQAQAALSRVGRGSTVLSLPDTDPGSFLFDHKNFLARESNCSLGRSPRWKGGWGRTHAGAGMWLISECQLITCVTGFTTFLRCHHITLAGSVDTTTPASPVAVPDKIHFVPEQHLVFPAHGHEDAGIVHQTNCN